MAAHAVGVKGAKTVRHPVRQQRRHLIDGDTFRCSDETRTALGGELRHADPHGLGASAEMSHVRDCCMHRAGEYERSFGRLHAVLPGTACRTAACLAVTDSAQPHIGMTHWLRRRAAAEGPTRCRRPRGATRPWWHPPRICSVALPAA